MSDWDTLHGQWNGTNTKVVSDIDDEIRALSNDLSTRLDGLMDFGSSTGVISQLNVGAHKNYRDTKANLESADAVIPEGVIAFETDTKAFKLGDGVTAYTSLEYFQIEYEISRKVGEVFFDAAPYERPGCVWTDYRTLSQSVYAELFSIIGHLYAKTASDATTADAAGMFHVPDGMFLFPRGGRTYKIDETAMPAGIVLTITGHGFATDGTDDGRPIKILRRTPSASPTIDSSVTEYSQYYIAVQDANTVRLYTTESDAVTDDGLTNVITFTGDGSGDIYASTMGCYQADQMQQITGDFGKAGTSASQPGLSYRSTDADTMGNGAFTATDNGSGQGGSNDSSYRMYQYDFDSANSPNARTGAETRGAYASLGLQIKVAGTSVTGETYDTLKYDTGWVANSDWTNAEFIVTHNLSADLPDLVVESLTSSDGTDANAINTKYASYGPGTVQEGISYIPIDSDSFKVQTGQGAYRTVNDLGETDLISGSQYYRVVVYKPDLFTKVKEVVDQEWSLSGNGVQTYTLPAPADVSNIILRWTGGTPDTDEVQIQAGTTINGIASEKWILEGEGFLELIPNKLATGYLTRNTGIWDTYDVTYDSVDYPQDKYTNGKIVRRGTYIQNTAVSQSGVYSFFSPLIPNVGESLFPCGAHGTTSDVLLSKFEKTDSTTITVYLRIGGSQSTQTYKSDGSGTASSNEFQLNWETKNTKWSV